VNKPPQEADSPPAKHRTIVKNKEEERAFERLKKFGRKKCDVIERKKKMSRRNLEEGIERKMCGAKDSRNETEED